MAVDTPLPPDLKKKIDIVNRFPSRLGAGPKGAISSDGKPLLGRLANKYLPKDTTYGLRGRRFMTHVALALARYLPETSGK
jgi:hypothetical protein